MSIHIPNRELIFEEVFMKVNRLLIAFFSIIGMHTAFATIFDIVNLASEQQDKLVYVVLYFKDAGGHVAWCRIDDRRRWMAWQIFNLGRLNIPAGTARMFDTVQIRIHSYGTCDIIQGGKMKTVQGRLHERHPEGV